MLSIRLPHVPAAMLLQNEKSGAFLPSLDGSRRLRDPRAMRNDYGRLPYHLAMRKGLTWLGEMLDPSVPVRYVASVCVSDVGTGGVLCCQDLGQHQTHGMMAAQRMYVAAGRSSTAARCVPSAGSC